MAQSKKCLICNSLIYTTPYNDWIRLCKSCHMAYDNVIEKSWKTRRLNMEALQKC